MKKENEKSRWTSYIADLSLSKIHWTECQERFSSHDGDFSGSTLFGEWITISYLFTPSSHILIIVIKLQRFINTSSFLINIKICLPAYRIMCALFSTCFSSKIMCARSQEEKNMFFCLRDKCSNILLRFLVRFKDSNGKHLFKHLKIMKMKIHLLQQRFALLESLFYDSP